MNIEFLYLLGVAIAGVVGFVFGKRHERKSTNSTIQVSNFRYDAVPEFVSPEAKKRKTHKTKTTKRRSGPKRTYKKRTVLHSVMTPETKATVDKASAATVEAANALSKIDPPKKERKPRKPANLPTEPQIA